jgi:hypothetical protein
MLHQQGVTLGQVLCVHWQLCFCTMTQSFIPETCRGCTAAGSDPSGVGVGHETWLSITVAQYAISSFMAYAAQGQKPAAFRDAGIQPGPGGGQGLEVDSLAGKGAGGTQQV